jgi:steroid 5-alpha reductase family enzyme
MLDYLVLSAVLLLNCIGFLWCYLRQSDKLTDLIYSLSFVVAALALFFQGDTFLNEKLLLGMLLVWAFRLGTYLFIRINAIKKDERFNEMRKHWWAIGGFWLLQTVSIYILLAPFIVFETYGSETWGIGRTVALLCWIIGFILETLADFQKYKAKKAQEKPSFVDQGLWKYLRHPNYTGEILCWIGMFVFVAVDLEGWLWLSIISPIWITTLLLFISGIPLLEKQHNKKYGHLETYKAYKNKTWRLVPFIY